MNSTNGLFSVPDVLWRCRGDRRNPLFALLKFIKISWHRWCVARWVNHFIVPSKEMLMLVQRELCAHGGEVYFLPNFFDSSSLQPSLPERSASKRIAFVGRLAYSKGADIALAAFQEIQSFYTDAELVFIGDGAEKSNLETQVETLGLHEKVQFLGWQNSEEITKQLRTVRAVILPSRWLENHPRSVFDAFVAGVPIIAPTRGGFRELINNDQCGFGCSSQSASEYARLIREVFDQPEKAEKRGYAGFTSLVNYLPDGHLAELVKIYGAVQAHSKNGEEIVTSQKDTSRS